MKTIVTNQIIVSAPTAELMKWCREKLTFSNPEYYKKENLGFYTGNVSKTVQFYEMTRNGDLILPFGLLRYAMPALNAGEVQVQFCEERSFEAPNDIPLFDYQKDAVDALEKAKFGVLESKAGSGKTRMGLALISRLHCKTLWLTHTKDLLSQSERAAAEFFDETKFGRITGGEGNIGETITFATVQTLAKMDLSELKYAWDCVIVDECHRVCGSPDSVKVKQFAYVLNSLACKHKYGLSATLHRSDGMTKSIFAYLGPIVHKVPFEALKDRIMDVTIFPIYTNTVLPDSCFKTQEELRRQRGGRLYSKDSAGTDTKGEKKFPDFVSITESLVQDTERTALIVEKLIENKEHHNLILSTRLSHLQAIYEMLPSELQEKSVLIDGSKQTKKALQERERSIEAVRCGEKQFLFATYGLAKEGLDIPILDREYLVIPQNDYSVVVQSVGRIARTFPDKQNPICYDFVDGKNEYLSAKFRNRCEHYRSYGFSLAGIGTQP